MNTATNKRIINAVKIAFEDMSGAGTFWNRPKKEVIEWLSAEISALDNADELYSFEIVLMVYKKANMSELIDNCLWASLEASKEVTK